MFDNGEMTLLDDLKKKVSEALWMANAYYYIQPDGALKGEKLTMQHADTQNLVVAGGCIVSLYHDEQPNDYDIFILKSDERLFNCIVNVDATTYNSQGYDRMEHVKATATRYEGANKLNYILTTHETREELIKGFDFKHCRASFVPHTNTFYISKTTLQCIQNKWLVPNRNPNNLAQDAQRRAKFLGRGFTIPKKVA
jgi:hypothetical protein